MQDTLRITLFADRSGSDHEQWFAIFSYRGEDRWIPLKAGRVEDAECEVVDLLASTPHLGTDSNRLRWSLAAWATEPVEGQVAQMKVLEEFTLAEIAEDDSGRAAA